MTAETSCPDIEETLRGSNDTMNAKIAIVFMFQHYDDPLPLDKLRPPLSL